MGPGSTLGFSGKFQGQQFDGTFGKFDAAISYDPANLATSKFDVTVDTSTAKTGDNDRDGALPGPISSIRRSSPTRTYVTTGFTKNAKGEIIANGNLTLHGVTKPVALKVAFKPNAGGAHLSVHRYAEAPGLRRRQRRVQGHLDASPMTCSSTVR